MDTVIKSGNDLAHFANAALSSAERQDTITGCILNNAGDGRWACEFLLEEYPTSDFAFLKDLPGIELCFTETKCHVRWHETPQLP